MTKADILAAISAIPDGMTTDVQVKYIGETLVRGEYFPINSVYVEGTHLIIQFQEC